MTWRAMRALGGEGLAMIGNRILSLASFAFLEKRSYPFTSLTLSHISTFSRPQLIFVDNHDRIFLNPTQIERNQAYCLRIDL